MDKKNLDAKLKSLEFYDTELNAIRIYVKIKNIIVKRLIYTKITPNQITYFGFLCFILSSYFFSRTDYSMILIGLFFLQIAYLSDYVDGSIAKLRGTSSGYGCWLDSINGIFGWRFVWIGITLGVYNQIPKPHVIWLGLLAAMAGLLKDLTQNFFMSIFKPTKEFRRDVYKRWKFFSMFRYTHKLQIPLLTLGAIFNKMYLVLVFCGIYGPLYVVLQTIILTLKAKRNH